MKRRIVFALIMGIVTTGIVSFTLVGVNAGFGDQFLLKWLRSWLLGYGVVIPAILFIGPRVQKLVDFIFKETPLTE